MAETDDSKDTSDHSYVVVARRYRPRGFDELVGQDSVGRALTNAIETNRVGHAYLFTGARGVGKTSTARIFAKALNDPGGPTPTPDNDTDTARAIDAGEDVDVIEIDGASNRGIDEIRSLRANVGVRPSRSRFKIYIIDEVHMLTPAAFNALLKTLEEPPEHVKFIFCTTDPEKIPITVLSRCQRFDFAPVEVSKITARLGEIVKSESAEADDDALELIARRATGSMRDSQSLLEQVLSFSDGRLTADQVHAMLGTADDERLHALARAMANRDAAETLRQMDDAIDAGVDSGRLAEQMLGYFRDLMAVAVGSDPSMLRHTSTSLYDEHKQLADRWGLQTVLAVVGLIDQTLVRIRHSVYSRVLLEATLIQICRLPDLQNIADLAAAASQSASTAGPAATTHSAASAPPPSGRAQSAAEKKNESPANVGLAANVEAAANDAETAAANRVTSIVDPPQSHVPTPHVGRRDSQVHEPVSSAVPAAPAPDEGEAPVGMQPAVVSPAERKMAQAEDVEVATTHEPLAIDAPWTSATVSQVWRHALAMLEPMTEALARSVDRVEPDGEGKMRLVFPGSAKLAMSRCSLPEHENALTAAVASAAGRSVSLELCADAATQVPASKPDKRLSGKERMQRMREIERHPTIQACAEQFAAEIVKVDPPR